MEDFIHQTINIYENNVDEQIEQSFAERYGFTNIFERICGNEFVTKARRVIKIRLAHTQ